MKELNTEEIVRVSGAKPLPVMSIMPIEGLGGFGTYNSGNGYLGIGYQTSPSTGFGFGFGVNPIKGGVGVSISYTF